MTNGMTNEEAIRGLLNVKAQMAEESPFTEAIDLAVKAIENQIPKKPKPIDWEQFKDKVINAKFMRGGFWCPNCGHFIKSDSYCRDCGQALDWEGL